MSVERGFNFGQITETKTIEINGVPVGIVSGYIATWQPDNWNGIYGVRDRISKGAYTASIQEHKARNNRQVRLKDHHGRTIGGFPIDKVKEDNVGLWGEGHVNLELQQGREAHSLARQKVLVDFSVGHIVTDDEIVNGERVIKQATLLEGSITDEPKNQRANIREVKSAGSFADLPILPADHKWDEAAARDRVMELKYADGNGADAFIGGQLIADVIDGKLMVVPAALHIAAEEIKSQNDPHAQACVERYFGKMEVPSPFEVKRFFTLNDVQDWTNAEYKDALASTGFFSNGAIRALVARSKEVATVPNTDTAELKSLIEKINEATNSFKR